MLWSGPVQRKPTTLFSDPAVDSSLPVPMHFAASGHSLSSLFLMTVLVTALTE